MQAIDCNIKPCILPTINFQAWHFRNSLVSAAKWHGYKNQLPTVVHVILYFQGKELSSLAFRPASLAFPSSFFLTTLTMWEEGKEEAWDPLGVCYDAK